MRGGVDELLDLQPETGSSDPGSNIQNFPNKHEEPECLQTTTTTKSRQSADGIY